MELIRGGIECQQCHGGQYQTRGPPARPLHSRSISGRQRPVQQSCQYGVLDDVSGFADKVVRHLEPWWGQSPLEPKPAHYELHKAP
jgi:hypothetical protein